MSLIIKDETAGVVILTIDNSGNICFGDGTPVDRLTLNGYRIIDNNGYIIHGGSPGRTSTVQFDTAIPASRYFMDFRNPGDPTSGGSESVTAITPMTAVHTCSPQPGQFTISNRNEGDSYVTDPSSAYYNPSLAVAPCGYRWN